MMVPLVDALFGVGALVGITLCSLGYYAYRTWDGPGVNALAAFVAVLGVGSVLTALSGLFLPPVVETNEGVVPIWGQIAVLFWGLSAIPWFVFSLQYTGRYTLIRWRTVGLLFVPFVGVGVNIFLEFVGFGSLILLSLIGTLVFIYCLALVIIGAALVVRSTHRYGHLSLAQGTTLASPAIVLFLVLNSLNFFNGEGTIAVGLYAAGFGFVAVVLGLVLVQYETLESAPAVGTIGERTIAQQTDDLVVVIDDSDRVVKCNDAVVEALDISRPTVVGESPGALLDYDIETLRNRETVTLETTDGTRRYDSQVSTITDQHDRELGALVSLHDVTDRELREQRLAVLNRVLRHNLRNKVEVVKSHAEVLEDEQDDEHGAIIAETAEAIANLGQSARTIDHFVSNSTSTTDVDVVAAIEQTLDVVASERVSVSLDLPESTVVETNSEALRGALDSAISNAVAYADSVVEIAVSERSNAVEITIADDGPGIPDEELESLDTGTETALQHGTGLGLWQLKWAVTTMGGDLEFDTTDGTTVSFTVPLPSPSHEQ